MKENSASFRAWRFVALGICFVLPISASSADYSVRAFLKEVSTSENQLILNTINMTLERVNVKLASEKRVPLFCAPKNHWVSAKEAEEVITKLVGDNETMLNGRWQTITIYLFEGLGLKYPCKN